MHARAEPRVSRRQPEFGVVVEKNLMIPRATTGSSWRPIFTVRPAMEAGSRAVPGALDPNTV